MSTSISEGAMDINAHALVEVVRQRDYLLGLLIELTVPEASKRKLRKETRDNLLAKSTMVDADAERLREVGRH
mgnify:CR=1 FL=1